MDNIWIAIISGGFSGAATVSFLGKVLVENAFKKSLTHYQHELDIRKQSLQTELSVNAEQLKLKYSQYEVSKKVALERIYASVAKTSFPRAKLKSNYRFQSVENFQAAYFEAFKEAFDVFEISFQKISTAYECLEDNAIYITSDLELMVSDCLSKVLASYLKSHTKLQQSHAEAQHLFREGTLSLESAPLDFSAFHANVQSNWKEIAGVPRTILKNTIRELLSPGTTTEIKP